MRSSPLSETLIGCCGWPEGKAKYFSRFSIVELQSTFYEPPSIALAEKWRALAPAQFVFCMKAWQLITHKPSSPTYRKLKSRLSPSEHDLLGSFQPTEQVWLAWERTAAIARALRAAVVIFQCPKSFEPTRSNVRNLHRFFSDIGRQDFTLAWEPRGEWPASIVAEICAAHNLVHCVDPLQTCSVHGAATYWRLHGKGSYRYRYSDAELEQLYGLLQASNLQDRSPTYVMFNNVWMKDDAVRFQTLLADQSSASDPSSL